MASSKEVILCESLIDVLTFWCAGYRNVTASYGVEGFTEDHREAFRKHGTERVLIAYDRDEAGDKAAEKLSEELGAMGIEVMRVLFPKGMDANEYAMKVQPAAQSLGLVLRQAQWMAGVRRGIEVSEEESKMAPMESAEAMDSAPRESESEVIPSLAAEPLAPETAPLIEVGLTEHPEPASAEVEPEEAETPVATAVEHESEEARGVVVDAVPPESEPEASPSLAAEPAPTEPVAEEAPSPEVAAEEAEAECPPSTAEPPGSEARGDPVGGAEPEREESGTPSRTASWAASHAPSPSSALVPPAKPATSAGSSSAPPSTPAPMMVASSNGDEVTIRFGERRWRVRGLPSKAVPGALRVSVMASREGGGFHVDTLELYSAKQRGQFVQLGSVELGVEERVLKRDLGEVLLRLEEYLEKRQKESERGSERRELTDTEKTEALGLLRDPRLLERILEDFERCGVVGESTNKLLGYLAATSRKLEQPLAVVIQSSSAAGKSSLMDAVLELMPEEERVQYSAMTGQSLFYMGETNLSHKILAIVEEQGAERASYALKLLQSEGELTIASTRKDPATGRLITQEYHVEGPVMIFQTTTAVDMDEELLNRCIVLTVDEGREQTRAIHERQRRARPLEGVIARQERQRILCVHQNAQRLIRPLYVVNPFAGELRFPDHQTRMRRDHTKYLGLIEAVALLHQYQRPTKTVEHRGQKLRYIEVTREDIRIANRLAHEVLGRSLDELPPQTRRLLGLLDEMVTAECGRVAVDRSDYRFSRRAVRERTGWGDTQLRVHLGRLIELEYVLVHRGRQGQSYAYELVYAGGRVEGPRLPGLVEPDGLERSTGTASTSRGMEPTSRGGGGHFAGGVRGMCGPDAGGMRDSEASAGQHENRGNLDRGALERRKARPGNGQASGVVVMPSAGVVARAAS